MKNNKIEYTMKKKYSMNKSGKVLKARRETQPQHTIQTQNSHTQKSQRCKVLLYTDSSHQG